MGILVIVGLLAGFVTGISPCIVPVAPVVFAAGTVHRRPLAIAAGLVVSFSAVTLLGSWLLGALGLPQDLLRNLGLVMLGVVAMGLIVPRFGELLSRPFTRLARNRAPTDSGGFALGLSLGLLYVPCAGPVLAAITVVGASHHLSFGAMVLTLAFSVGAAVPLLGFALAGQRLVGRMQWIRTRVPAARKVAGVVLLAAAVAIAFNVTSGLQRDLPGYTDALQRQFEANASAKSALGSISGHTATGDLANCAAGSSKLQQCGVAPVIRGITAWRNTPNNTPLTLAGLKGRVVLVDFWTYSCINCQRALPHVEAWNRAYASAGLTIIGVHTPEFAFEHVPGNVTKAAAQLGVRYPIAIDNQYATWNAYGNEYWPADYLIDATGHVRYIDFGEGDYGRTEGFIRALLAEAGLRATLPRATKVPDETPTEAMTPETYLGYDRMANIASQLIKPNVTTIYTMPADVPQNGFGYGGTWTIGAQKVVAGHDALLQLRYQAAKVFLVIGGHGTVDVSVDGSHTRTVDIGEEPTLYTLVSEPTAHAALLGLRFSSGVDAYAFTFG